MAEVQQKDSGDGKKGKPKKMHIHVDFTPMVDMNMLLITFFMLCTTLKKPQTMEISMPSNDKNITEEDQTKVAASRAITILLGGQDKVYYYSGQPDYTDYQTLNETTFAADGLRAVLQDRNREIVTQLEDLKKEKLETGMTDEDFNTKASEIKNVKTAPVVMIKGSDESNYKNLIDALDEMHLCGISKYAIVDITEGDQFLIDNYESKGELSSQIDTSKL